MYSIAFMNPELAGYGESESLKKLFENKRGLRAAIARAYKSEGISPSLIGQQVNGSRPISLRMALIYSKELNCPLDDVSPSWAAVTRYAAALLKGPANPYQLQDSAMTTARYTNTRNDKLALLMQLCSTLGTDEIDYLIAKARTLSASEPATHERKRSATVYELHRYRTR